MGKGELVVGAVGDRVLGVTKYPRFQHAFQLSLIN